MGCFDSGCPESVRLADGQSRHVHTECHFGFPWDHWAGRNRLVIVLALHQLIADQMEHLQETADSQLQKVDALWLLVETILLVVVEWRRQFATCGLDARWRPQNSEPMGPAPLVAQDLDQTKIDHEGSVHALGHEWTHPVHRKLVLLVKVHRLEMCALAPEERKTEREEDGGLDVEAHLG